MTSKVVSFKADRVRGICTFFLYISKMFFHVKVNSEKIWALLRFDSRCLCEVDISAPCYTRRNSPHFMFLSTLRTTLSLRYERIRRTVRVRKEVSTECEFNCYFKKLFLTRHFYHYFLTILLIFHTPILHTFATFAFFFFFHTPHFPQTC